MTDLPALMDFAHRLADAARIETMARFRETLETGNKDERGGFDPVTEADRAAERAMRALIEAEYPDHGIAGEEYPDRPAQGRYVWSLDPIDGTRAFICGMPTWVTLIALLEDGKPVAGLIDAPAIGERYSGLGSAAAFGHHGAVRVSDCKSLAEARFSTTDPYLFRGEEAACFERVRASVRTTRYGFDGYAYARLAAGGIDLVMESGLKPYDYNALIPVIRAAGGTVGDWRGGENWSEGRILAAATPDLFDEAVRAIRA